MITIVSGFGRCGSSLVMQMLDAGGMQTAGEYPAFECDLGQALLSDSLTTAMLRAFDGHAIKFLDPHRGTIPAGPQYKVIWMTRDLTEQAKSQVKFLSVLMGVNGGRELVRKFKQSYIADRPAALKHLLSCRPDYILELRFEQVLANPMAAAKQMANYIGGDLNTSAMAAVVVPRSPLCADDMALEISLIEKREKEKAA